MQYFKKIKLISESCKSSLKSGIFEAKQLMDSKFIFKLNVPINIVAWINFQLLQIVFKVKKISDKNMSMN